MDEGDGAADNAKRAEASTLMGPHTWRLCPRPPLTLTPAPHR